MERNLSFVWERDSDGCIGCMCGNEECPCYMGGWHEVYVCIAYDENSELVDSLGSICEPTQEYMRQIESEIREENS